MKVYGTVLVWFIALGRLLWHMALLYKQVVAALFSLLVSCIVVRNFIHGGFTTSPFIPKMSRHTPGACLSPPLNTVADLGNSKNDWITTVT